MDLDQYYFMHQTEAPIATRGSWSGQVRFSLVKADHLTYPPSVLVRND